VRVLFIYNAKIRHHNSPPSCGCILTNSTLQIAIEMGIRDLDIFGDSLLVINQLRKEYEVKIEDLVPCHKHALRLRDRMDIVKLEHVPRSANKTADALASLIATLLLRAEEGMTVLVYSHWILLPDDEDSEENGNTISVFETNAED